MKDTLSDAFENIDPKFIEEAAAFSPTPKRRIPRAAIASIATAAALIIAIVPTALVLSKPSAPTTGDTPPGIVDPGQDPPGGNEDPPTPGASEDPPQAAAPMSLGETRETAAGTVAYLANTSHSVTIRLHKTGESAVWFRLAGSNGSSMYYAATDPSYAGMGTRVDAFTFTVNGVRGGLPTAAGDYEIVIDYAPLANLCSSLGELYSTLGAFFLA